MAEVFQWGELKNPDLVDLTDKLSQMAKSGEIRSIVAVVDFGNNVHKFVVAGNYLDDPGEMFRPSSKLFFEIQRMDEEKRAGCTP